MKVGLAHHAYRGAPRGIAQQFPDAPEKRQRRIFWSWSSVESRRLALSKNRAAFLADALSILSNLNR